jgi:uncharacterized membrane protein
MGRSRKGLSPNDIARAPADTHNDFDDARPGNRMVGPATPDVAVTAAVAGGGVVVAGLLAAAGVPVERRTVLAATPWMVVGGLLHTLAVTGAYDGLPAGILGSALAAPAAVAIAGLPWLALVQIGRVRPRADPAGYLAATGGGALVPLLAATVLFGRATVATVVPVVLTPVIAAIVTAVVVFVLGLSAAPAIATTRSLGLLVVYAQAFHAVAIAVAVDGLGTVAEAPLTALATDLAAMGPEGFGSVWPLVAAKLAVAVLTLVVAGRVVERRPVAGYLLLGVVAALGIGPGVATLLAATLLA